MFQTAHLSNFWKVKDVCQGICSELNFLTDEEQDIDNSQKQLLQDDYNQVKDMIDQITATGYFNKSKEVNEQNVVTLVNKIMGVEKKNASVTANIWHKQLSNVNKFNAESFKLCVRPFFNLADLDVIESAYNSQNAFVTAHLISNSNIVLKNPMQEFSDSVQSLPFGFVYDVNANNFIAACDQTSLVNIKSSTEITDKDFVPTANKQDKFIFVNGYATRLKTPAQIIKKYSNDRFTSNDNVVILDGDNATPVALFYYGYGLANTNVVANKLAQLAQKLNLPLIEINLNTFYSQNGKFIMSNSLARTCFNSFVDNFNQSLVDYCGVDCLKLSKKLVGFNTNLRYNFVYKFMFALQKHFVQNINLTEAESKDFVTKAIAKSIAKKNLLTKEREEQNGAPLMYPSESTFVPVPKEFLSENK